MVFCLWRGKSSGVEPAPVHQLLGNGKGDLFEVHYTNEQVYCCDNGSKELTSRDYPICT